LQAPKKDKAPPPSSKPAKSGGGKQKKKVTLSLRIARLFDFVEASLLGFSGLEVHVGFAEVEQGKAKGEGEQRGAVRPGYLRQAAL